MKRPLLIAAAVIGALLLIVIGATIVYPAVASGEQCDQPWAASSISVQADGRVDGPYETSGCGSP